ncbi:MAG: hypothetical protein R2729_30240 [Bryobacteraceae bacterium]
MRRYLLLAFTLSLSTAAQMPGWSRTLGPARIDRTPIRVAAHPSGAVYVAASVDGAPPLPAWSTR